ncbi:hypothetical protein [Actinomadura sp. B10D3]|uniref:hypothetical protein n=1 Tax=Actinomadura sp. B10D3 TaxID=3153557 RepID=UPI00325D61A8
MEDDRERLRALFHPWDVPEPEAVQRGLAEIPAVAIADFVLDDEEAPGHRATCAEALVGRVPAERAAALIDLACSSRGHSHAPIGTSLVAALNTGRPFRNALRAMALERNDFYVAEDLGSWDLLDDAKAGDAQALGVLTVLASAPWDYMREEGEHAIELLIELRGLPAVLAMLGAGSPEELARSGAYPAHRLLGLRLLWRADGDITFCLGDDSAVVSEAAYELLAGGRGDDGALTAMAEEGRPGYLWALALLHQRGHDIRPLWELLGPPQVEVLAVPPEVWEVIVRGIRGSGATARHDV